MTKLAIFRRQASVGAHVTLRLTRGEAVSGQITELDDSHVCLDRGGGETITVFEDILAGWELHRRDHSNDEEPGGGAAPDGGRGDSNAFPATPPSGYDPGTDPKVLSALVGVKATFSEAVKRARLEPPAPNFQFPESDFSRRVLAEVRREWDRARNQYNYALKVKELSRLASVVGQVLDPLAKRYPDSAAVRSLLGRVLLKLNRQSEAKDHLAEAAARSETPDQWIALASAAGNDTAVECYALRRYFSLMPPQRAKDAWFRYLSVAVDHGDLRRVAQVIHDWSEQKERDIDLDRLLAESLVYLLSSSGSESLATQAAANLVHAAGKLPQRWKEEFDQGSFPSEKLLDVAREFTQRQVRSRPAAQTLHSKGGDHVQLGRIVSFGNQRFGFIDVQGDETLFFRIDDVQETRLHQALLDGSWRTIGEVEFDVLPSYGHKYRRAVNVVRLQDSESLLQRARNLLHGSQHSLAMALVRRVLSTDPTNEAADQLEEEVKEDIKRQLRDRGTGLPKGEGPYARAKRAQLIDQDLKAAEELFNQAIRQGDKPESAIKDLASVLQQQGRAEHAIALLRNNAKRFKDSSYDNMLATLYQHAGRHDDAIRVLTRLRNATKPPHDGPLLRRIALSHVKRAKYDDAERVLQELLDRSPDDRSAARWLASLEDARQAGSYDEAEKIIEDLGGLAEEGVELSSLARAAIEHCTYEGVNPAALRAGTAGTEEVAHVEELAKQLGTKRPRDRAAYYLSAAALLMRESGDRKPGRIYSYLRRYFASMAYASWNDKKAADVVRSYYVESLALVFDDNLDEAWRSLLRYLATFSPAKLEDVEATLPPSGWGRIVPRQKYRNGLQKTLAMIETDAGTSWLEGLFVVGSQSSFARRHLGHAILTSRPLQTAFASLLDITRNQASNVQETWQSRCREHERIQQRRLSICRTWTRYQINVASMEELGAQLRDAFEGTSSEVDRRRMNALGDIVIAALGFCRASDFEERERNYWLVTTQVDRFREEVIDAPTQYSHEGLLPVADRLRSLIEEEYAQMARTSGAELSLRLLVDEYVRGQKGELRLQIEVSNKRGCSPASSVQVCLGPGDSKYFAADRWEREVVSTLRGGNIEVTQMEVHPKAAALEDRAFSIDAVAVYQNRLGEEKRTEAHAWTVRLYPDEEFQYLENPYTAFAEGGPVDEPEMFVGRDDFLNRLEGSLLSGSGSKSIVMFGQKRAGKSSLLEHLRRRLVRKEGIVPICFSLQEIAPELSVPALFHRILQGASEALEKLQFDGRDVPDFSPPGIEALESHATPRFHDAMSCLVRAMRRGPSVLKLILLVDEFTDIFKEIRKERIPREFMKAWKAIIEKKYFASVLVGQDIMPAFKAEFPNEFGVTEDIRVTYLADVAAAILVRKPIGEERFAGSAVARLLNLTAGSPYYTMMFCARLVDYMNTTHSVIVTEADILAVEEEMLSGDRRLTRDKFDNLLLCG